MTHREAVQRVQEAVDMPGDMSGWYDPVDLDCLDVADLEAMRAVYLQLAAYATVAMDTQRAADTGDKRLEARLERDLERAYGVLPAWAKW